MVCVHKYVTEKAHYQSVPNCKGFPAFVALLKTAMPSVMMVAVFSKRPPEQTFLHNRWGYNQEGTTRILCCGKEISNSVPSQ